MSIELYVRRPERQTHILTVAKIVTQASAGFCGQSAEKILSVDHRTVCRFDTQFGGYMPVLAQLKRIRAILLSHGSSESENAGEAQNVRAGEAIP